LENTVIKLDDIEIELDDIDMAQIAGGTPGLRIFSNAGTLSSGINMGQGEFAPPTIQNGGVT
jgi:hypothetical protein